MKILLHDLERWLLAFAIGPQGQMYWHTDAANAQLNITLTDGRKSVKGMARASRSRADFKVQIGINGLFAWSVEAGQEAQWWQALNNQFEPIKITGDGVRWTVDEASAWPRRLGLPVKQISITVDGALQLSARPNPARRARLIALADALTEQALNEKVDMLRARKKFDQASALVEAIQSKQQAQQVV